MTVRIAYNLFAQKAGLMTIAAGQKWHFRVMVMSNEWSRWEPDLVSGWLRRLPRPDLPEKMEGELEAIVGLKRNGHSVFMQLTMKVLAQCIWARQFKTAIRNSIYHAETVSERNIERIGALGVPFNTVWHIKVRFS